MRRVTNTYCFFNVQQHIQYTTIGRDSSPLASLSDRCTPLFVIENIFAGDTVFVAAFTIIQQLLAVKIIYQIIFLPLSLADTRSGVMHVHLFIYCVYFSIVITAARSDVN